MCALDERPQLEAASALNLSVATMKSRVFRGKRILARSLAKRLAPQHLEMAMPSDGAVRYQM